MTARKSTKPCPGRRHVQPSRRQFLSGLAAGAAFVGCGDDGSDPAAASGGTTGNTSSATTGSGTTTGSVATSGSSASSVSSASSASASSSTSGSSTTGVLPPMGKAASDQVQLGSTGITISRLAMGSGTHGNDGASDQTRLGLTQFADLLVQSYDQGITFWETADQYGAHAHLAAALSQVGRQNVVVLTKTHARTAAEMEADLTRFMQELGTDYIDIMLLHNKQSATWSTECAGAMEYLEDAKRRGLIRAHGVSCHTLSALQLAAQTPWVEVDLARINPAGVVMDADPATVISVLTQMKSAGKGVIGMKILGEGRLANQLDMAIEHAVRLDVLDGFTIGFTSRSQLDEITTKIAGV